MAATIRQRMLIMSNPLPSVKVYSAITMLAKFTHCRRHFYIRLCSSGCNFDTVNSITTNSAVDKSATEVLERDHKGTSGYTSYQKHPGIMVQKGSQLPVRLIKAMQILFEKYPVTTLSLKVDKLVRYLQQRQHPVTDADLAERTRDIESKILEKDPLNLHNLGEEEVKAALEKHRKQVINKLRSNIYHWKPVQYDAFTSYVYLMGRTASDYSVLLQTFTEISKRDDDFKPTTIFYNGSKVGSGIWAADKVWKTIHEHYCVEESIHMNTIAQLLLQDGNEQKMLSAISGVHFRQFMPSSKEHKFSIVVSSYMLMEQPSQEDRQQLIQDLWEMTNTYLVLVEIGTGAGFTLINEAKEFILKNSQGLTQHMLPGHVFAPCPHDKPCPKLRDKNQPCLTESVLREIDFTSRKPVEKPKKHARYSYVILKKGPRKTDTEWPRVLHPIKAHKHVHVHMCLPCGDLQHVVITKGKFEKHLYGCAKCVQQGDRLPVSLSSQPTATTGDKKMEDSVSEDSCSIDDRAQMKFDAPQPHLSPMEEACIK